MPFNEIEAEFNLMADAIARGIENLSPEAKDEMNRDILDKLAAMEAAARKGH